jgi:hypothetical protein
LAVLAGEQVGPLVLRGAVDVPEQAGQLVGELEAGLGTDEIVELAIGDRAVRALAVNTDIGNRDYAISRDGGETFSTRFTTIPDPVTRLPLEPVANAMKDAFMALDVRKASFMAPPGGWTVRSGSGQPGRSGP